MPCDAGFTRGSVDDQPAPTPEAERAIKGRIDRLHLDHPYASSRMLRNRLRQQGVEVGQRHVGTLMRRMGIQAHRLSITMVADFCVAALRA